jgi:hypothetical protein
MGTVYQKAVQFCLKGIKGFNDGTRIRDEKGSMTKVGNELIGREDQARQDVGQLELGIEKKFFWMVVEELGQISE